MIPPRGQLVAQNFQRELAEVQSYIQARLQTDDPYLLSVNPAQVAEYQDEIQHYVKQKQQLRRPLPMGRSATPNDRPTKATPRPVSSTQKPVVAQGSAKGSSLQDPVAERQSDYVHSVVPKRLPGVEWLLANTTVQPPVNRYDDIHRWDCPLAPSIPVAAPVMPLTPVAHGFAPYPAMYHRMLKKQKTM